MKSTKFYKILSIVLLILNIGTLVFFYVTKPPHPPRPGEHRLSDQIALTGDSKKKVDALEKRHHRDKRDLMQQDMKLHKQLYGKLNSEQSDEILVKINTNRLQIEKMTYDFFSDVAQHCNNSQRKKLNELIDKSLRRIIGAPPKKHK